MKKILFILVMLTLFASLLISVSADETVIQPRYNNAINAAAIFNISTDGNATLELRYIGYSTVFEEAIIVSKIQKNISGVWVDVDIETPDNQWVDTSAVSTFSTTHSVQLAERGLYRAVVTFEIRGSGGAADIIEKTVEKTY